MTKNVSKNRGHINLSLQPIATIKETIETLGLKLYHFHRNKDGPLKFAHLVLSKIRSINGYGRYLILSAATALLMLKILEAVHFFFYPKIKAIINLGELEKANGLIFFNEFVNIALILFIICLFFFFPGSPEGKRRLFLIKKGRPVLSFFLYTPIIALVLILGPGFISRGWSSSGLQGILPQSEYLHVAIATAFCFGLSLADIATKKGAVRWWILPFLVIPTNGIFYFPLLWWNAIAGWLPSKYWNLWRPVFLLGTAIGPILAYPLAQPFLHDPPVFIDTGYEIIGNRIGYGIQEVPGAQEAYISAVDNLQHYKKENSRWLLVDELHTGFGWDEASFDFKENQAYIHDGNSGHLHILGLNPLSKKETLEIPYESFPFRSGAIHQAYDANRKILAIGEDGCFVTTLDMDTMRVRQSLSLGNDLGYIARILNVPSRGELLILTTHSLTAYRLNDLTMVRSVQLPDVSYGMIIEEKNDRVFVGFPQIMEVAEYSLTGFELRRTFDGPAGLRSMVLDPANKALFLGSVSGVLEIRKLDDLKLVRRVRLMPWMRRMAVIPESREILLTSRSMPIVWSYLHRKEKQSAYDQLQVIAESIGRKVLRKMIINNKAKFIEQSNRILDMKKTE